MMMCDASTSALVVALAKATVTQAGGAKMRRMGLKQSAVCQVSVAAWTPGGPLPPATVKAIVPRGKPEYQIPNRAAL